LFHIDFNNKEEEMKPLRFFACMPALILIVCLGSNNLAASVVSIKSITITPRVASVFFDSSKQFTAIATDLSGALVPQPVIEWSVAGSGTITSSGLYTADTTAARALIIASCGGKSDTATAVVISKQEPLTLLLPDGGQHYAIGDSLIVKWRANTEVVLGMILSLSFNGGEKYWIISGDQGLNAGGGKDASFTWVITDSLSDPWGASSCASDQCLIKLEDYNRRFQATSSEFFEISKPLGVLDRRGIKTALGIQINCLQNGKMLVSAQGPYTLSIMRLDGKIIRKIKADRPAAYSFSRRDFGTGVYMIKVNTRSETVSRVMVAF
jgi:hypothetical protein